MIWSEVPVAAVVHCYRGMVPSRRLDQLIADRTYYLVNFPSRAWSSGDREQKYIDFKILDGVGEPAGQVSLPIEDPDMDLICTIGDTNVVLAPGWVSALADAGYQPMDMEYLIAASVGKIPEYENRVPYGWQLGQKIPIEQVKNLTNLDFVMPKWGED